MMIFDKSLRAFVATTTNRTQTFDEPHHNRLNQTFKLIPMQLMINVYYITN